MCGKTVEIFARKCLLLKALHVACDELEGVEGCVSLTITPEFAPRCENLVNKHDPSRFVVTEEIDFTLSILRLKSQYFTQSYNKYISN